MTGRLLRLSVIFVLLFAVNVSAETSVPVIAKTLPGVNLPLISTVDSNNPGYDRKLGCCRIDILRAVEAR